MKIFQNETLRFFKRQNLSLEKDFGYSNRAYLKGHLKFSDAEIDGMLKTPWKFILHLSPGVFGPLIQAPSDITKACDFLFFSHVSTKSLNTAEITKKALFSGLKVAFKVHWRLGLRHIVPALLNLGMLELTVLNKAVWTFMDYRIDKNGLKFDIQDHLPQFFKVRILI